MTLLLFIWQFPQIVVGYIVKLLLAGRMQRRIGNVRIYSWAWRSGVSLGWFCFVPENAPLRMLSHEYGHMRQSLYLGPLYFIVVGIPSFVWACLYGMRIVSGDYYRFYTERWAEKLGASFSSSLHLH